MHASGLCACANTSQRITDRFAPVILPDPHPQAALSLSANRTWSKWAPSGSVPESLRSSRPLERDWVRESKVAGLLPDPGKESTLTGAYGPCLRQTRERRVQPCSIHRNKLEANRRRDLEDLAGGG